eukprot:TRINITY_DN49_c0_g3_i1.p1 TRINITY_DN49_c0_g3~~TRINITY_DN49_c0_g3_i1.p1  ORF type:complete len:1155 (-),score=152.50 TRINITY_DN49_c0_g3_i1:98-3562(-)
MNGSGSGSGSTGAVLRRSTSLSAGLSLTDDDAERRASVCSVDSTTASIEEEFEYKNAGTVPTTLPQVLAHHSSVQQILYETIERDQLRQEQLEEELVDMQRDKADLMALIEDLRSIEQENAKLVSELAAERSLRVAHTEMGHKLSPELPPPLGPPPPPPPLSPLPFLGTTVSLPPPAFSSMDGITYSAPAQDGRLPRSEEKKRRRRSRSVGGSKKSGKGEENKEDIPPPETSPSAPALEDTSMLELAKIIGPSEPQLPPQAVPTRHAKQREHHAYRECVREHSQWECDIRGLASKLSEHSQSIYNLFGTSGLPERGRSHTRDEYDGPGEKFRRMTALLSRRTEMEDACPSAELSQTLQAGGCISCVATANQNQQVWIGCRGKTGLIRIYETQSYTTPYPDIVVGVGVRMMAHANSKMWVACDDPTVRVYDTENPSDYCFMLEGHTFPVNYVLHVGKEMWTASADQTIRVWSAQSFKCLQVVKVGCVVRNLLLNCNAVWLGTIQGIYHCDSKMQIVELPQVKASVNAMACVSGHMQGDEIWSAHSNDTLAIWDATNRSLKVSLDTSRVNSILYLGSEVWTCSWDKIIRVWDVKTRSCLRELSGHTASVSCLCAVPARNVFVWSGSEDRKVFLWEPRLARHEIVLGKAQQNVTCAGCLKNVVADDEAYECCKCHDTFVHVRCFANIPPTNMCIPAPPPILGPPETPPPPLSPIHVPPMPEPMTIAVSPAATTAAAPAEAAFPALQLPSVRTAQSTQPAEKLDTATLKLFKDKPHKALQAWISRGLISNEGSPRAVAEFLVTQRRVLDPTAVGDYLGTAENAQVLAEFATLQDFSSLNFEMALRRWMRSMGLPGESQKIDRLMQAFADGFYPVSTEQTIFASAASMYVLAFSCTMLNTSLHNPQSIARINMPRWIDSNAGLNEEKDFPKDFLEHLYYQIQDAPFEHFNPEPSPIMQGILIKRNMTSKFRWCTLCPNHFKVYRTIKSGTPRYVFPTSNLTVKKLSSTTLQLHAGGAVGKTTFTAKTPFTCAAWLKSLLICISGVFAPNASLLTPTPPTVSCASPSTASAQTTPSTSPRNGVSSPEPNEQATQILPPSSPPPPIPPPPVPTDALAIPPPDLPPPPSPPPSMLPPSSPTRGGAAKRGHRATKSTLVGAKF